MRVVVAPDKFKGSLGAGEVVAALGVGFRRGRVGVEVVGMPVADGGDGTVGAFVAAGWERVGVGVVGPTGEEVEGVYAVAGKTAVVELAAVVGLGKLPGGRLDPMGASTYGLGQVIAHALESGVREIVLGLGGSASTDGGAGMLQALGLRILDGDGCELPWGGAALARAARIDRSGLHPALRETVVTIASDVDNPLLGIRGAAAVFGEQKGADASQRAILEAALINWARVVDPTIAERPGAGAAGGTGFGAMALLGAVVRPGIGVILELIDFDARIAGADLVVTGEGSLDEQTLHGKAPMGVCEAARAAGIPVVAVAGRCSLDEKQWRAAGFSACYTLSELEPDPKRSMADAAALLEQLGARIAREQLPG
ncbi:glycerate kinase [Nocardia pseudobrasiliensis]|uniref:Glycerate kinase n=1 Tax=Nocardia pseudobrasiliensis TaxID=45979 RepID=A0A370HXA9_9NOCA|nr:glycerate kinase [Nocardia pseudobrasiliensis]RDI63133.1 glycerate kinase [Nocardia pseudobrasiliensis]